MRDEIYTYIKQQGFRPSSEIYAQFSNSDRDLIAGHLDYLVSVGRLRKIKYSFSDSTQELYYLPV